MPKPGSATATLAVSCNPCTVGSIAQFTGTGYTPHQNAHVKINGSFQAAVPVADDGTVDFGWYMSAAATYDVELYQEGPGGKLVLKGEVTTVAQ